MGSSYLYKTDKVVQKKEEGKAVAIKKDYSAGQQPILQFKLQGNAQKENSVKQLVAVESAPSASNITGIPDQIKARAEQLSGMSMDDVRVHYHSSKPAQVQALAYTQGTDIYVGPGQEKHIGHELGHVVQQKRGTVQATTTVGGQPVNDMEKLEKEADQFGNRI